MQKKEAKGAIVFRHYLRANPQETCTFENKDTRGKDTFYIRELKDKQRNWAEAIESDRGVLIRHEGGTGEPDYIYLRQEPAYVVIRYTNFGFVVIRIKELIKETTPSLTWERAKALSLFTIEKSTG